MDAGLKTHLAKRRRLEDGTPSALKKILTEKQVRRLTKIQRRHKQRDLLKRMDSVPVILHERRPKYTFVECFMDSEATDSEVTDSEVLDLEATNSKVTDSEVLDLEATNSEVTDSEVLDPEVADLEVADSESSFSTSSDNVRIQCAACHDGIANQFAHMEYGGCLYIDEEEE
jgi:hypothetical protein